jgi:hypothetical protein
VEVERFISNGEIYKEDVLEELFAKYSEQARDNLESSQNAELATV